MNRFKVIKGSEAAFETSGYRATVNLKSCRALYSFTFVEGPKLRIIRLCFAHGSGEIVRVRGCTKSEALRAAHSRAGDKKPLYLDHPHFDGFKVHRR
jgi:hypothetical protein